MAYSCTLCGGTARMKSQQNVGGMVSLIIKCETEDCPGHGVRFYHNDRREATETIRGTIKK